MSAAYYPQVQKIYVAYYGRPADPAGLQYWAGQLAANGGNLTSIINAFGNSSESTALYAGASDSAKVTAIYQQLFNRAPDSAGLAFYTGELTAGRMTAASIALNVANGASGTDLTFLNNKVTVGTAFTDALTVDSAAAVAYTGTTAITAARSLITGVTTSAATTNVASTITSIKSGGGATAGQTFTLTTDDDTFTGTIGNDTFVATSATLSTGDRITDVSSTDSDVMNVSASADLTGTAAMDVTNVETINISWTGYSKADISLDNVDGAEVVVTATKSAFVGNVTVTDAGSNNITTGASVDGTLEVDGLNDGTVTSSLAKVIDLGTADGVVSIVADVATEITVASGDSIAIDAVAATDIALTGGTFDTATLTVGTDVSLTANGATDALININSDEDITVDITAGTFEKIVVGGEGSVDLVFQVAADLDSATVTNTGGTVELSAALIAMDLSNVNAGSIVFDTAPAGAVAITVTSSQSITLAADMAAALTFNMNDDTSADVLNITIQDTQAAALDFYTATSDDVENINITIDADSFTSSTAVTLASILATGNTVTFVSTGTNAVTVTAIRAEEVDATAVDGDFTITQGNSTDMTIIGGAGDNEVTFAGVTTTDSTYIGQDGDDDVTFVNVAGTAVATFGDGDNTVSAAALTTGVLVVEAGSGDDTATVGTALTTGSITLDLGDGDNTVNLDFAVTFAADGEVTIVTGGGDDTISIGAGTLAADVGSLAITLGAGSNTLELVDGVNLTGLDLSVSGLDVIELTSSNATASVSSDLLDSEAITIKSSGGTGVTTAVLNVELADGVTSFDGSELTISDSTSSYVLGLEITVVTAADDFTVIASDAADEITTGSGDDTITGGDGDDTITGGTGEDTFVFASSVAANGADDIAFTVADDVLDFSALLSGLTLVYEEIADDTSGITTAANVIVSCDTGDSITDLATTVAADATVTATKGLLILSNGTDLFIYYSTNLAADGTETLIATLTGITDAADLLASNFSFS